MRNGFPATLTLYTVVDIKGLPPAGKSYDFQNKYQEFWFLKALKSSTSVFINQLWLMKPENSHRTYSMERNIGNVTKPEMLE